MNFDHCIYLNIHHLNHNIKFHHPRELYHATFNQFLPLIGNTCSDCLFLNFVSDFLGSTYSFVDLAISLYVSVVPSFSLLSSTPMYKYNTINSCFPIPST